MKWSSLLCCVLIGCASSGPSPAPDDATPKPHTETVFTLIADRAIARPADFKSTDDVYRIVRQLADDGDITAAQLAAYESKMGKAPRALTKTDLDSIRGL